MKTLSDRASAQAGLRHGILFLALILVSSSGPFLVMAEMNAYDVAFARMFLSAVCFLCWAAGRRQLAIERRHLRPLVVGAVCLAAHFVLWIKAFDLTDYASNLLLLVFQPIIAAFLGIRMGERPTRNTWIALFLSLVGLAVIARGDFALGPRALLGDLLCVLGDLAITLFYVAARRPRAELPLATFMGVTMGVGSLAVLPLLWITDTPGWRYPTRSWLWLAAIVAFTTLGGHGLMNVAANRVRLFTLNIVIVLEPAIGIAIGAALFSATIAPTQLAGGLLLAIGVVFGLRDEKSPPVSVR